MSKFIDAEKLKAEIKRYKNKADERLKIKGRTFSEEQKDLALQNLCGNLLYFIDSFQQEPRFPQYDNIVEKVFGAGNLEGWEFREAEMLVVLAKEELLKSIQQEQPSLPDNLDEAAWDAAYNIMIPNYPDVLTETEKDRLFEIAETIFKAGAKWYASQMKMPNSSE